MTGCLGSMECRQAPSDSNIMTGIHVTSDALKPPNNKQRESGESQYKLFPPPWIWVWIGQKILCGVNQFA